MSDSTLTLPFALGTPQLTPVPFDPEIAPVLEAMAGMGPELSVDTLQASRAGGPAFPSGAEIVRGRAVTAEERVIPGPAGAPDLEITIFRPEHPAPGALPILVNFHGGGMILGHRSWEHGRVVDLVERHGVIGVNVEYRLAPEHPYPAGAEDNYAATAWVAAHAAELGGDAKRLIVMGGSAGGAFAAAVALMARDRGEPAIAGQLLLCPMLDNTNASAASLQYDGIGTWTRASNLLAWNCVLGPELASSPDAPAYAAPARADDLSGLPPAFIEVGAAEMFRDENTEFASRIWATGGSAELHVWAGAFHGFDMYAPESELARAALASRDSWLRRILNGVGA
ncbi:MULTISPECIES: alpha/beta hydrolase [unclassified Leucobacter]|uniref:alpha/beta hydrolase n=1 Tax=unclassified Leucobacter TaxID=2621730 RepID=UPI00165E7D31|nr:MULTISPECIES: alpha/beta hydrolase [unclassified Leucobacter]MBC9937187.1 alpha/beta hydrolase [Leucobacter sp. cx-87]